MGIVHEVFLSLGSNLEPERHLVEAVRHLQRLGDVLACSRAWQSPPADGSQQPDYLNAAVLLATELDASELYERRLPAIEAALGRRRDPTDRYAPRTIDIDLSLFDRSVFAREPRCGRLIPVPPPEHAGESAMRAPFPRIAPHIDPFSVKIPDPDILTRPFVAIPLAELAPSLIHPITGEPLATIAARLGSAARAMTHRDDVSISLRRVLS